MKPLHLAIPVFSLLGLVSGGIAGAILWRQAQPLPPNSILAWVWFIGGFVSFAGGITLISRLRSLALLCIFGGFVVLLCASLYLHEARRIYDLHHSPSIIF